MTIEIFEAQTMVCSECGAKWPDYASQGDSSNCYVPGCDGMVHPSNPAEDRWWWWSCEPGCLPDGEPSGPFDTEAEAEADSREGEDDGDDGDGSGASGGTGACPECGSWSPWRCGCNDEEVRDADRH